MKPDDFCCFLFHRFHIQLQLQLQGEVTLLQLEVEVELLRKPKSPEFINLDKTYRLTPFAHLDYLLVVRYG